MVEKNTLRVYRTKLGRKHPSRTSVIQYSQGTAERFRPHE